MKDKYPHLTKEALEIAAQEGLSMVQAQRKLNVPRGVMWFRTKRFGIKFTNERILITQKEVRLIEQTYLSGLSIENTAKHINISYDIVCDVIKQSGFSRKIKDPLYRKYQINHEFFKKIDSEEKAYFLGLLYADGCALDKKYCISLSLHSDDFYMVEKLGKAVYLDHSKIPFKFSKRSKMVTINIQHKEFYKDTVKQGVFPRKSFTVQFPNKDQVPPELMRHFIRGVFDGDGCVGVYGNGRRIVFNFVCGSRDFIEEFRNLLLTIVKSNAKIRKTKNIYSLSYTAKEDVRKIFNFLYDGATIFLTRKHKKFIDFYK